MTRTVPIPFFSRYQKTDLLQVTDDAGKLTSTYIWGVWEPILFPDKISDFVYTVREADLGRIDNLAYAFYGNPNLWWVLASHNLIVDPLSDMYVGQKLKIPSRDIVLDILGSSDPATSQTIGGT